MYFSEREHPLVCTQYPRDIGRPVLTVELYPKWYGLQLISIDGSVNELPFPDRASLKSAFAQGLDDTEAAFVDHVPNPIYVMRWASQEGHHLDELALELIIGRWVYEVKDAYENV